MKTILLLSLFSLLSPSKPDWGFYAHKKINRLAVFTLPPQMISFYKANIEYIEEASVTPDKRRYAVEEEGARHYLDADHYGEDPFLSLPQKWQDAVGRYGEDSLRAHGVLPWHLLIMYFRLRDAFMIKDPAAILRISAEFGHYIADAHVPLHTTKNYNGQLTGQEGIHGFWESRLPELFSGEFDFFVGRAEYIRNPRETMWEIIMSAHSLVNTVLKEEKELSTRFGEKKHSFETRGAATVKVYAEEFAEVYHRKLDGMVEKQMRAAIKMTGSLWYTAWVDAGLPELHRLIGYKPTEEELERNRQTLQKLKAARYNARKHEE